MDDVSLVDIMNFMKKEKEARARERAEDKEEIRKMIADGVKDEVQKNILPIQARQDALDSAQAGMSEKLSEVMGIVNDLKSRVDAGQSTARLVVSTGTISGSNNSQQSVNRDIGQPSDNKLSELINLSRRTVGLSRIDKDDLIRMRQAQYGGATNEQEEKSLAVKEFLKCELKISEDDIKKMIIENILLR